MRGMLAQATGTDDRNGDYGGFVQDIRMIHAMI